jgi:hypothetical protein
MTIAAADPLGAQDGGASGAAWPPAIEDNSFFIEEAYNQEEGVVQHISTFMRFGVPLRTSDYGFTQEWPLGSQTHQLSVTLPYSWSGAPGGRGFSDTLLNYRYQLFGHDGWAAFAPRLSLVLPTGSEESRKPGVQVNLPASKRLNARLVAHANAGATFLPATETRVYNVGASVIGLLTPRLNLMLELVTTFTSEPDERGRRTSERETIVSPGLRYAINVGELQIVPGLAVPFRHAGGRTSTGVFAYLSFEHPFKSRRAAERVDAERPAKEGAQGGM